MVHDEAVQEFLIESNEGLDQLDRELVALESNPDAPERIATIFRAIHTIKGTSGFLGLAKLEALTHAGESLLSLLRDGTLRLNPDIASSLLALVDRVRGILREVEATGREGTQAHDDLARRLASHATPKTPLPVPPEAPAPHAVPPPVVTTAAVPPPATSLPPPPAPQKSPSLAPADAGAGHPIADTNVRVDVGLLDKLMNLVGELVLARNQILQVGERFEDHAFIGASQRLNLITTELQEQVMKTRMQPIGNVWSKLPRVVRDLAIACGKQVRVEMHGKDTELDRTILEAIKDPLTHIIRNAVDHGLEAPDVRAAKGKGRTGSLVLRAFHESGQVNVEIADDGAGLNHEAIAAKAVERKLITPERARSATEYELAQLIFLPGFSTAERVTSVSGRGVGMDVVKTNIERIGGTVDLTSRRGAGTTLKIRIPLTLAIVPALVVVCAGQRYAIPQANLIELVRIDASERSTRVEYIGGTPFYRLRGQLLPIIELTGALGLGAVPENAQGEFNIIVVQADERQFGLVVDEVRDTEEIVVKPLGKELKGVTAFAGATIMGDGRVALILDVVGLAQQTGVLGRPGARSGLRETKSAKPGGVVDAVGAKRALLLFGVGGDAAMAIPLAEVARLEEFGRDRFEGPPGREVVQYRGKILPLISLADVGGGGADAPSAPVNVIVYSEGERSVGFVVASILDVVEDVLEIERCGARARVLGSAVVQSRVVDVLDVRGVIQAQAPWFFERGAV